MAKTKTTKAEKTPLLTTHKATTPAPAVTRAVMLVTPALAAEWLKSNTRNRDIKRQKVRRFANEIIAGRWHLTHQGIAFGSDGMLYDGQHRLSAIILSGVPIEIEVTRGLAARSLDGIDYGGDPRSAADVLKIADGLDLSRRQKANLMVAATLIADGNLNHPEVATPHGMRTIIEEHGAALSAMESVFGKGQGKRICSAPVVGSLMVAWASAPTMTVSFATSLHTGVGLEAGHPALLLRNLLLDNDIARFSGIGMGIREALSLRTFSAVAAFVRGDSLRMLKASTAARAKFIEAWGVRTEG